MKYALAIPASGLVMLFVVAISQSSACTQAQQATAKQATADGVVAAFNCEGSSIDAAALVDATNFASAKIQAWITGTASDLRALKAKILADLAPVKSNLGRCAVAGALAIIAAIVPPTSGVATSSLTAVGPDPVTVQAVFSSAARELGWAPVKIRGKIY